MSASHCLRWWISYLGTLSCWSQWYFFLGSKLEWHTTVPISKHCNVFLQPFSQVTYSNFYCAPCQHFILNRRPMNFQTSTVKYTWENQDINSQPSQPNSNSSMQVDRHIKFNRPLNRIPPHFLDQGSHVTLTRAKELYNLKPQTKFFLSNSFQLYS